MKIKAGLKLFYSQIPVFFIFGLVFLLGLKFFDKGKSEFFQKVFFEHFAINSIVFILLMCVFISGCLLFFIGSLNLEKKVHHVIYNYIVLPPVKLGITLCSVAFALTISYILMLLFEGSDQAIKLVVPLIEIAVAAIAYWCLSALVLENRFLKDRKAKSWCGALMIAGAPLIAWIIIYILANPGVLI